MDSVSFDKIKKLVSEITTRENCVLYDLEWAGSGNGRILRVYIDKNDGSLVSLEDCTNVSRGLDFILDAEEAIAGGKYNLEVSSPGLEKHLKELWHFEKAVGQEIRFETHEALASFNPEFAEKLGKRKRAQGFLIAVDGKELKVKFENMDLVVPVSSLSKAHVVFDFNVQSPKRGKNGN